MIGIASGRVTAVNGQMVTFDEPVRIEAGKTYAFRYRLLGDTRSLLRAVDAVDPNDFRTSAGAWCLYDYSASLAILLRLTSAICGDLAKPIKILRYIASTASRTRKT